MQLVGNDEVQAGHVMASLGLKDPAHVQPSQLGAEQE